MPRPQVLAATGAAALLLLLSGCSEGGDNINQNRPDDQPEAEQQLVPRTPEPLPSDQNLQTPPLVVPLPGPTGGTPGVAPSENMTSKAPDSDRTGNN
ncbi:MAG: hypothetical protein JWN57_496 [Frankiales bacterium]|nr:hypothetical protein [Frankiales bacterium]